MPISRNNSNFLFCPQLSSLFPPLRQVAPPAQKFVDERPLLEWLVSIPAAILICRRCLGPKQNRLLRPQIGQQRATSRGKKGNNQVNK
jgi:hypothetical protein